jgi:hypothetical protein
MPMNIMNPDSELFGAWRKSNGQPYLELRAPDNYSLGKLEGKFLERKIVFFKHIIKLMKIPFFRKFSYKDWIKLSREHVNAYPSEFEKDVNDLKDELRGIADIIKNISYDDLLVQNSFIELLYGELVPNQKKRVFNNSLDLGCTSFGFKKKDGSTFIGQNFDFNRFMLKPAVSFVKHKLPDKPEIFSFRLGGMLALPAGKNSHGVKMNVNIVKSLIQKRHIFPTGMRTRLGYNMKSAKDVHNILTSQFPESICYNLIIADNNDLISCEISPKLIIKNTIKDWVVKSNTFVSEKLQKYLGVPKYSKERQQYGENKARELYINGLSEEELMKILSDKPTICRVNTVAFFTDNYYGIGNPFKDPHGKVPILK